MRCANWARSIASNTMTLPRAFGRLESRAQRKRDQPGLELTPVVTIPERQRKLERPLVKGVHQVHVTGDGVDASDGTDGHSLVIQYSI
jgi:hypothetical protein